jgi:2-oxoglutarate dehydrogenase complex dehydrogenase (E1) component-like enzyme
MTPKSLLRFPDAASPIDQFTSGGFLPVIGDDSVDGANVTRVLLCSGKVYYDLVAENKKQTGSSIAIVRVEQFYPFPKNLLVTELSRFSSAADVRWVQEEPQNMGGWSFVEPRLLRMLGATQTLRYIGRPPSASPATGSHTIHQMEQQRLVREAFVSS